MPIFEYHCTGCGSLFEKLTFGNERTEKAECGRCGGIGVKVLSVVRGVIRRKEGPQGKEPSAQRRSRCRAPLPHDRGGLTKVYDMELDAGARSKLGELAAAV